MKKIEFGTRRLVIIDEMETGALLDLVGPKILLLSATPESPSPSDERIIKAGISADCVEFCCIGSNSEILHDFIDGILEDRGLLEVATTWHSEEPLEEALYYFVNVAGGRPPTLVAVVRNDSDLQMALKSAIESKETTR